MSMDAAYVLEQFQQDLANVPEEVAHYLEEIKTKDIKLYNLKKRIQHNDNAIQKHIRAHGSLTENPKEAQYNTKIIADFETAMKLQEEKCDLANKLNDLVVRHLKRLDIEIKKLQNDGVLAPSTEPIVLTAMRALSTVPTAHSTMQGGVSAAQATAAAGGHHHHLHQKRSSPMPQGGGVARGATPVDVPTNAASMTASMQRPTKKQKIGSGVSSMKGTPGVGHAGSPMSAAMLSGQVTGAVAAGIHSGGGTPGDVDYAGGIGDQHSAAAAIVNQIGRSGLVPRSAVNALPVGNLKGSTSASMNRSSQKLSAQQSAEDEEEDEEENNDSALYCFCQQVSYGDMVACDNPDCQYEWFHYGCVGLKAPPSGVWYCSTTCQEKAQSNKRGRK
ncbi:inhibitor of growth proteins N-terminal histone-binding-domain-containing protein [Lipomyces tetrasporus]|uniref:Chromatin modification-related protein YNG2 n=1 Tax=Lipomyces tetrasporus TaxID=54092 RepID=A0AAD7QV69_9ASCO|nr:inhibitor of growth proteins N-terminal histone-binding-domain-containing protein [Lipomyces tetrasporus]KAJ8102064.1 inhibitor of growth proteins N-terminal histone-binding-domain-containing protein [Lipomyces tetrasporus]